MSRLIKLIIPILIMLLLLILRFNQPEPTVSYKTVTTTACSDYSLHMNIIDVDKFVKSYYAMLKDTNDYEKLYSECVWYREIAEQLGVYPIYDSARTIVYALEQGSTSAKINQLIQSEVDNNA